jgi:hypothetical protein
MLNREIKASGIGVLEGHGSPIRGCIVASLRQGKRKRKRLLQPEKHGKILSKERRAERRSGSPDKSVNNVWIWDETGLISATERSEQAAKGA